MRRRGKILVIRGGAIGDFILTLPVLAALRNQFPDTHLEVLGYPHIAKIAQLAECADAVRAIEARPLAQFFAKNGDLDPAWIDYFAGFNIVLSYLYDPDNIFRTNLARCSVKHWIQGPHRPDSNGSVHATSSLLEPLQQLAIFDADAVPRLPVSTAHTSEEVRLAVHPGSGGQNKNWPVNAWSALVEMVVKETPWKLVLIGGEAESDALERLTSKIPVERREVFHQQPLDELALALGSCTMFAGHDSGISHLAAAVGLPCLILWGPTNDKVWRPLGERVRLLKHDSGLETLSPATVFRQLLEMPDVRG